MRTLISSFQALSRRLPVCAALLLGRGGLGLALCAALAAPAYAVPQITGYAATNPRGVPIFSAPTGAPVLIEGARLGTGSVIWFNGIPTSAVAGSAAEILVTVPPAPFYPYQGPVVIQTGGDVAFGPLFTITPPAGPTAPPPPIPATADGRIQIANLSSGATLRYSVALLRGAVLGDSTDLLRVTNASSPRLDRISTTAIYQGRFKALVELVPGSNTIDLQTGDGSAASLTLNYVPMTTPAVVRMIYLTDNTGNTLYPTQKVDDPQDYAAKLGTAAKLMQTFTAERLNDMGFGRKTFNLEMDAQGQVIVHTVRAPKPAAYYQSRSATQVWSEIHAWIDGQFPMATSKDLVILAVARWDPTTKRVFGGDALGGGSLATFVNLDMFTWPSSLQDVPHAFTDITRVDTSGLRDDSGNNGHGALWNVAATTAGVPLQMLGFTFGLDYSRDPRSIMLRGYDFYNLAFMAEEPPVAVSDPSRAADDNQVPYFDKINAALLAAHPWLRPD